MTHRWRSGWWPHRHKGRLGGQGETEAGESSTHSSAYPGAGATGPLTLARLEQERRETEQMLKLATQTPANGSFTFGERTFQRIDTKIACQRGLPPQQTFNVVRIQTGERSSVGRVEEDAFWLWAVVETLRHSGLRIEELL